jgi:hypothetical protein
MRETLRPDFYFMHRKSPVLGNNPQVSHIPITGLPGTWYTLLYKFSRMAELALKIGAPMTVRKHAKLGSKRETVYAC